MTQIDSNWGMKSVSRRLLVPLGVIMVLLIIGSMALLTRQHRKLLDDRVRNMKESIELDLQRNLRLQADGMGKTLLAIGADPRLGPALQAKDSNRLLADWGPVFTAMAEKHKLTHFYFMDPKRICLLRVHKPEKNHDQIDRFTARAAERSGRPASGIELGPLGTFTLRVVMPVFQKDTLLGYLELGKEIEDILDSIHDRFECNLAVIIHKEYLTRPDWEAGMQLLGREPDWNRYPHGVISFSSLDRLPEVFDPIALHEDETQAHTELGRIIPFDGERWRVFSLPLYDVEGIDIGDLLIMTDVSRESLTFIQTLIFSGVLGIVLLALLMLFVWGLLRRTDEGIRVQQEKLRESEGRFRGLFQNVETVAVQGYGMDGITRYWNAASERLYGYTAKEAIGSNLLDLIIPPEMRSGVEGAMKQMAKTGQVIPAAELALRHKDGSPVQVYSCHALVNVPGHGLELFCIDTDLSERNRAQELSRESEERFKALAENSQDLIMRFDRQHRHLYANPVSEEKTGVKREQFQGKTHQELGFPADLVEIWETAIDWVFENAKPHRVEFYLPPGAWFDWALAPECADDGSVTAVITSARDISKSKKIEAELRQQEALLQAVAQASQVLLSESQIEISIPQALELVGKATGQDRAYLFEYHIAPDTKENLISQRFEWVQDGVRSKRSGPALQNLPTDTVLPCFLKALQKGETVAGPVRLFSKSEQEMILLQGIVSLLLVPVVVDQCFWGFVGLDNCHSEKEWGAGERAILSALATSLGVAVTRHRSEEILRQSQAQAEAASAAKSQFLANMSHEIRTPINGVMGMLQLLQQESLTPKQKRFVDAAFDSSGSLLSVIGDVLDLSKIEVGHLELNETDFELRATLDSVMRLFRQRAKEQHIQMTCDVAPELPERVVGDANRLRQILINLLGNALKFTDTGKIDIAAGLETAGDEEFEVRFSVRDTGPGIPQDQCEKIFESFTQGDLSMHRQHGGTGLGLSISRGLVAQMGGRIWVESQEGQGSTFFFTVRLSRGKESLSEPVPAPLPLPAPSKTARILLVEDNKINQEVAHEMLIRLGYHCDLCESGQEALAKVTQSPADLILMDCQMPGMDGYEATTAIRAWEEQTHAERRVPIVALTAHAMKGDRERCLAAGMDDYLTKPLSVTHLATMISKWLGKALDALDPKRTTQPEGIAPTFHEESGGEAAVVARCSGNRELAGKLLRAFVKQTREDLTILTAAAQAGDTEPFLRAAHRLKGAAGNLGLEVCQQAAETIEDHYRAGHLDGLEPFLKILQAEAERIAQMKIVKRDH